MNRIVAAVTNYVARRLVERERALAGNTEAETVDLGEPGLMAEPAPASEARKPATWSMRPSVPPAKVPGATVVAPTPAPAVGDPAPPLGRKKRPWSRRLADALSFLLMTLGSVTLVLLLALGAYLAWTMRLHDLWTEVLHRPPPF